MNSPARPRPSGKSELNRLRRFVSKRRFVAGRRELIEQGFSGSRIKNWLRGDRLVKLFHGVYSFGRDVETRESVWQAALLVAGPGGALTGRSALELWGAVKPTRKFPAHVQVATPADRGGRHRGLSPALRSTWVEVVRRKFEPGDLKRKEGLAVVKSALALIDFAISAPEMEVRFAFLELCRLRLFGKQDVGFCYRRLTGKRGATKLKPLLALWVPELSRIRSVLEGLFLLAWVELSLEMPQVNVKVFGREVDMYWARLGIVLELDGHAFHSDPIARQRDIEKTRYLESKGLRVIRVTWKEFMEDPAGVINRIRRELGLG